MKKGKLFLISVTVLLSLALTGGVSMAATGYTQQFLMENSGTGCYLSGPEFDWRGNWYVMKRDPAQTTSYLYRNYSPGNDSTPFITIAGAVASWGVTSDRDCSYLYYKLLDKAGLYRLPLRQGATSAEYKEFAFDGSTFLFDTVVLAEDPNEFLLMSPRTGLNLTIGLFSYDGGVEPSKTWTCTLPSEWETNYNANTDLTTYHVQFEATTGRVWVRARKTYTGTRGRNAVNQWFFTKKISEASGPLDAYDPAVEIPGWSSGGFKELYLGRYARIIQEYSDANPASGTHLSLTGYDPVSRKAESYSLTQWTTLNGSTAPLDDFFWTGGTGGNSAIHYRGFTMDAQKNLYVMKHRYIYSASLGTSESQWRSNFSRFARYTPPSGVTPQKPACDSSITNHTFRDPNNVILIAVIFDGPADYRAIRSRWRIFRKSDLVVPIYDVEQDGPTNSHTVRVGVLTDGGEYVWQVSYDWEYSSVYETIRGATAWSDLASFSVSISGGSVSDPSSPKGGGGCDAGLGFVPLSLAGLFLFGKRRG